MKIQSLIPRCADTDRALDDIQAELDDLEMFGGSPEAEQRLRRQLAALRQAQQRNAITLEKGDTVQTARDGGWGRLHYVSHAMGPRKPDRDFWICSGCRTEIAKGQEHYRRSYYSNKRDNRSGHQLRLCLNCYADHAEQHPCNTMFPVYRPARRKAA